MRMNLTLPAAAIVAAGLLALPSPAAAISAGDVVDKMGAKEQYGYITGAVDMVLFLYSKNGQGEKAECGLNWFYNGGGGPKEVIEVFHNYKDKPAIGLLYVLIERHCK